MVDTVSTNITNDGLRNFHVHLQGVSDGTGETAVVKVDISTLIGPNGTIAPASFSVKSIQYDVAGFSSVQLFFDATTDDQLATMSGPGFLEFDSPLKDPRSTGFTGDILLTSNNPISGAIYDIYLNMIKRS